MNLRSYQVAAHDAVLKEWEEVTSTLVVLPTGTGKTVVFSKIIESMQPQRAMVVAAREELIFQAREKIMTVAGLKCCVEMGELSAKTTLFQKSDVVVATVQTLNAALGDRTRMSKFDPKEFGVLVLDECHHATAQTYRNVIHYFTTNNPKLKVLGVTATPDRADEEALGQVFETVAFDYEILNAIDDGWLVPVRQQMVFVEGLDLTQVRTTAGDLNGADMAAILEAEKNLLPIASASIEIIGQRKSLMFAATVKQAQMLCDILNRHRPGMAQFVHGGTPKEERREILEDFQQNRVQVLCNCDVFTEGFDSPGVEVIILAKMTKSRSKYAQWCGRSMRTLPGLVDGLATPAERRQAIADSAKPHCLIVDFAGSSGKHKLMTTADILDGNYSEAVVAAVKERCAKSSTPVNVTEAMEEEQKKIQERVKAAILAEQAKRAKLVAKVKFTTKTINPFDAFDMQPVQKRGWDNNKTLSTKQRDLLMRTLGVDPDELGYAAGKQLLNETFRRWKNKLCTVKQATTIKKFLPNMNTREMGFKRASAVIDLIAKNNWRVPESLKVE